VGLGLLFFGAEGSRTTPFSEAQFDLGTLTVSGQTLWVLGASAALIVALYLFFGRTLYGKALRATAINRVGARLMGISTTLAGKLSFTLAAGIGALSGILIAPITTVYYDTGFLVGLKGFVAAIIAGLASYPLAAAGAILVGLLESFSSFWASAFKEVIVFTLIIPVLLWRSLHLPSCGGGRMKRRLPLLAFPGRWCWPRPCCPSSTSPCSTTSACTPWWRWAWCCSPGWAASPPSARPPLSGWAPTPPGISPPPTPSRPG
jgi:hypothetical protein